MRNNQGYIALVTVLIISGVALAIAATVSLLGIGVEQSALTGSKGENALQLAEGCAEDGLLKSQQSSTYNGGNITRPEGTCIISVSKSGNNWTITATSTQTDYNRTVVVQFVRTSGSPIAITSWQESVPVPTPTPPLNWYNSSWVYREAITIDHTKVPGTQTNFPVLINLAPNTNLQTGAQSTGNDILFTDATGLTKIPHEIETYTSATGALVAWVKVPSVSSTADTTIYMYYGNPSAANQQNTTGVWDSNYKGVWHMKENPAGTAPQIKDSTSNANSGTTQGSMTSGEQTLGKIDGSLSFAGSGQFVNIPNSSSINTLNSQLTASAWVNGSLLDSSYRRIISADTYPTQYWYVENNGATPGTLEYYVSGSGSTWISNAVLSTNTWYYVVMTSDSTAIRLYINGVQDSTGTGVSSIPTGGPIGIAADPGNATVWVGKLDEVRISNTSRSANWIKTEYNNQSSPSTFYSVAPQETY